MKFYNRDSELQFLAEVQARASREIHLTLLLGRRQVGKTLLIRKHIEASRTPSLYFFVSRKSRETLLEEFSEILATRIPVLQNVHLTEFETFFKILFDFLDEHSGLVVFDEFQNFRHVDSSVFSVLQKHWDARKENSKGQMIIVGSVLSLMRKLFENDKEPLFNRATDKLNLQPFDLGTIRQILLDHQADPRAQLLPFFAIFGGTPRFYDLVERADLFGHEVNHIFTQLILEPNAILRDEGKQLTVEAFGRENACLVGECKLSSNRIESSAIKTLRQRGELITKLTGAEKLLLAFFVADQPSPELRDQVRQEGIDMYGIEDLFS